VAATAHHPLPPRQEEVELADDEKAIRELVRANLRFAVLVAEKYQDQGVPRSELIRMAVLGLFRAASKFDEAKGITFLSYAVLWVRLTILEALAEQGHDLCGVDKRAFALLQDLDLSKEEIQRAISLPGSRFSKDGSLKPGEEYRLLNALPDSLPGSSAPDYETYEQALNRAVEEAFVTLKQRDARILRLYFGRDGQEPMTLEEIGSLLGITPERVQKIKDRALLRLRRASRERFLETFTGGFIG
jgi:RNA polymerase primary sigma factor